MQHPKDVKGSDRPLPRNDGKFVLDGKRVRFSDYGGSSKETSMSDYDKEVLTASALLYRLDTIETDLSHVESDASDLGDLWCDSNTSINNRLDHIESEIEVMAQIVTKNTLALDEIEKRIAIMQEKIDGIN